MDNFSSQLEQKHQLSRLIKTGLIRELFRRNQISRTQFEQLMRLQRT